MAENNTILPHDILAEQAVIGSVFVDPDKILIASEYLTKESFYKLSHGIVFEIMEGLADKENQLTPYQLNQHLIQ